MSPLSRLLPVLCAALVLWSAGARADAVDPARMASARKYLEVTHAADNSKRVFDIMLTNVEKAMDSVNPGKNAVVDALMKDMFESLKGQIPVMLDASATVYGEHFTKDELDRIIAFYQTPTGAKLVHELPAMMAEVAQATLPIAQRAAAEAIAKMKEKALQQGLNLPKGI